MRKNGETDLSVMSKKGRHIHVHIRPRRSTNATSADDERGRLILGTTPRSLPLFVSFTLHILIVALLSIETTSLPSSSLAFNNHNNRISNNNFEKRIRIRTTRITPTDCNILDRGKRGATTAHYCKSSCRVPLDFRLSEQPSLTRLCSTGNSENADDESNMFDGNFHDRMLGDDVDEDLGDKEFLEKQLAHLENMEKMLEDIEDYCSIEGMCEDDEIIIDDDDDDDEMIFMGDVDDLEDMESLFDFLEETAGDVGDDEENFVPEEDDQKEIPSTITTAATAAANIRSDGDAAFSPQGLEEALLQGVVPVDAGVGSNTLPGDFGFDPLGFAEKDYVQKFQYRFLDALPGGNSNRDPPSAPRPSALALRDYREAEIRHGRLAMLAVVIWPIQEILDQFFLDPNESGPILYGPVTLPYLPLFMTLLMMLLGYLDIYTKDIQEEEGIGDAFLPGDCFWDPLRILDGAPATMKRNMQERELFNGRVAMLAFAAFVFEEATSQKAIIDIPGNEFLFVPAYQIPSVQEWLDAQFLTL